MASSWVFTTENNPDVGRDPNNYLRSINDNFQVSGEHYTSPYAGGPQAFEGSIAPGPTYTNLPGTLEAGPINNSGEMVAYTVVANVGLKSFIYQNGHLSHFAHSGAITGLANNGSLVGTEGNGIGFLDEGGHFSTFSGVGTPEGINDSGTIVTDAGYYGSPGHWAKLSIPGASSVSIYGINDINPWNASGRIQPAMVGDYISGGVKHGFTDIAGTITAVDAPGASATVVYGVNNGMEMAGGFWNSSGEHGFLAAQNHGGGGS